MVDLMFRDESSHVIKKAAKTRARGRAKNAQASKAVQDALVPGTATPVNIVSESSEPTSRATIRPGTRRQHPSSAFALVTRNFAIRNKSRQTPWPPTTGDSTSDGDDDNSFPSSDEGNWPTTPPTALLYSLSPSYQERGMAYFFSRYVSVDENACHQNYDFIFDIWRPASMLPNRQVDGVMASMTAVGLAGLSNLTMCPRMMDWSRRSYGTALRLTNDALRNPSEAVKDTTMLAILILGTYEMLTGRSPPTVRAWQEHINGASALAKMRGLTQFMTKAGARMFVMLTQIVLINCIQRDEPMPQPLVELRNQLGMLTGPNDPNWRISGPIYNFMQLRHDIKRGKFTQMRDIIDQLSKLDQEFVEIIAILPVFWRYRPVELSAAHPAVFGGRHCDVYPALTLAATWNGIRSIRIMVHETIIGELFKGFPGKHIMSWPYEAKLQLAKSVELLEKLRDTILASVPQHFGIVNFKDAMSASSRGSPVAIVPVKMSPVRVVSQPVTPPTSSPSSFATSSPRSLSVFNGPTLHDPTQAEGRSDGAERFMTLASASNTIVWPLYLLGVSSCCTHEVKDYVVERLQAILEESGLTQARAVALMVRNKEVSIPWSNVSWDQMPQTRTPADMIV
ncbi:hypothetical protein CCHL11_05544 [Colletotrichum chlorophyti]|uniref:Uncharacterized protein n=1 Tax=Colletotrichum chlorophyti TaxID=708187 RepID=A0A1Q8RB26_9PEZI|nr:hypothetical protein CCHL11_05544 [Colletotrichum chlorophyti]